MNQQRKSDPQKEALRLPPMSRGLQAFSLILVFIVGIGLTAFVLINPLNLPFLPGSSTGETATTGESDATREVEQLYQCPMHPEVIEDEPGDCPICGMKLMPMDAAPAQPAAQLYQCPMHPEVIEDEPGDCPICLMKLMPMDIAPADAISSGDAEGVIRIDPVQVQNIGVVSEPARRGTIARTVRTVGILDFNAERITWINIKYAGWIEKVYVNYVGDELRRGDPLFEIYSPDLVATQEEYLRALEYQTSLAGSARSARRQAESLLRSTRNRLNYWDVGEDQIEALEQNREVQRTFTVRAPADGVVAEVMDEALEGKFVEAGMNLYKLADLSSLWAHADVYESDLPWVREGQPAEVRFRFDPERTYRGKILFLYPKLSQKTRTLKICVEVPNEQGRLRAGMYADVVIEGPPIENAILIPDSAVLRSGKRDLVFVDRGAGHFEPRELQLGIRGEGNVIQVEAGLQAGEAVVTQAQFMLDSESRVREAIAKFMDRGSGARSDREAPR